MTATRDRTIAARVPVDLRDDLEALAAREQVDLTHVIRAALREHVDRRLHGNGQSATGLFTMTTPVGDRITVRGMSAALDGPGVTRRDDPATSKRAASDVAPRAGSQRRAALAFIAQAGQRGATTDEVIAFLELATPGRVAVNGIARRVTDLLQAGAIEPIPLGVFAMRDGDVATRPTRNGAQATVYIATPKGRQWLEHTAP